MYAQVINKQITQVVNEQQLREMYPSTHFPSPILAEHLEGFDNWYICEDEAEVPAFNSAEKKVSFNRALSGKKVIGSYTVVDLSPEEKNAIKEARWIEVKYHRNNTLAATDYLMISDVFNSFSDAEKAKIEDYRKKLRDITDQENPFSITWPVLGIESITLKYNVEI